MYLFGSALNEFLSIYATVNSFHQLIITDAGTKPVQSARISTIKAILASTGNRPACL